MIPVDGDFILEVAPRFSGEKAQRQREIVEAISGHFSEVLENYEISTFYGLRTLWGRLLTNAQVFEPRKSFTRE